MEAVRGIVCNGHVGGVGVIEIGVLVSAALGVFSVIAKATPTKVDNRALKVLTGIIHALGLTKKG